MILNRNSLFRLKILDQMEDLGLNISYYIMIFQRINDALNDNAISGECEKPSEINKRRLCL